MPLFMVLLKYLLKECSLLIHRHSYLGNIHTDILKVNKSTSLYGKTTLWCGLPDANSPVSTSCLLLGSVLCFIFQNSLTTTWRANYIYNHWFPTIILFTSSLLGLALYSIPLVLVSLLSPCLPTPRVNSAQTGILPQSMAINVNLLKQVGILK